MGARNLAADNMPSKNTFANKFSNFWYKVETGIKLSDNQSGYRLYPLDFIKKTRFITRGYEFEVEVIVRAFLAQSVERAAFNRKVVGSSPTGGVF